MNDPAGDPGALLPPIEPPHDRPVVATIGNFDGVHVGHRALLATARGLRTSGRGAGDNFVLALAFDPHPAAVLRPGTEPPMLSDSARRAELLRLAGADAVGTLRPSAELLELSPESFFDAIADRYRLAGLVEGHDFHFGRARAGTPDLLRRLAESRGIAIHIAAPVEIDLHDQTIVTASSTMVRWLLARGRVADAARVLGRPYELRGQVVRGDRLGRTIGVPTANLATRQMLPGDGVYAGRATLPGGRAMAAAIHVGPRATVGAAARTCEAHLIGPDGSAWSGPACTADDPEYGWPLRLEFAAWLRGQARFESLEALLGQMRRDIARAGAMAMATA